VREDEGKHFEGAMEGFDSWCIEQWLRYIIKQNHTRFKLMNEWGCIVVAKLSVNCSC
jgi:hypothetical protein